MSEKAFSLTKFIIKIGMESYKLGSQIASEEAKIFTIALVGNLGEQSIGYRMESKSHFSISASPESTLDVLISNFNKMNSFVMTTFH